MVRILKVKELEDRKKLLLAQSEMYRETIRLEAANVKFSLALMKRRMGLARTAVGALGLAAPALGLLLGLRGFRRGEAPKVKGRQSLFAKIMAATQMFRQMRPLIGMFFEGRRAAREARERQNIRQFP